MRVVPAVDILGGLCVNLVQGDYDRETVFSADPVSQAVRWYEGGGEIIHLVDLDGAQAGRCCVEQELRALAAAGIPFEIGGGIRNLDTVRTLIEVGAQRVILGTLAHRDPAFVRRAAEEFPEHIVVGIDAKAGKVALSGWLEVTETDATAFAKEMEAAGAVRIIYTDILSDGMMKGPNIDATRSVARAVNIPVTISGGVSSLEDIRHAREAESDGIDEIIIGRALYLKAFSLSEAIAAVQQREVVDE